MRVVLVQGSAPFQSAVIEVLNKQPDINIVGRANTSMKGVKLVSLLKPDLVLVDFMHEALDGAAVTRELKSVSPSPKVIMLSHRSDYTNRLAAISAGADGYVESTDLLKDLIPLVNRVTGHYA